MSRRLLLLCVLASLALLDTEAASTLRSRRQADCDEATDSFDACTNAAYDDYKAAFEAGDDGKPDWMARKACNYMTAAVEECGNELIGECYSEMDVIHMKDDQLRNVLEVLEKSVEEWDTDKCEAVKAHVERMKYLQERGGNVDFDNDGIINVMDNDDDNDGIEDDEDPDDDNDGILDGEDYDDDNDGIPDNTDDEGDCDEFGICDHDSDDYDGNLDDEDNDDDNDGIPDALDNDDDNDGIPDDEDNEYDENDIDQDGIPDLGEEDYDDHDGIHDEGEDGNDYDKIGRAHV